MPQQSFKSCSLDFLLFFVCFFLSVAAFYPLQLGFKNETNERKSMVPTGAFFLNYNLYYILYNCFYKSHCSTLSSLGDFSEIWEQSDQWDTVGLRCWWRRRIGSFFFFLKVHAVKRNIKLCNTEYELRQLTNYETLHYMWYNPVSSYSAYLHFISVSSCNANAVKIIVEGSVSYAHTARPSIYIEYTWIVKPQLL